MGCLPSKSSSMRDSKSTRLKRKLTVTKWSSETPITSAQLKAKRQEFWETQPYYGVVWETLQGIVDADMEMKQVFIDTAGLTIGANDLSVFYDQKGYRYELPQYVLSEPTNLIRNT